MGEIHAGRGDERTAETVLGEDIDFCGEASFTGQLMIKGRFSGTINSDGDLYIEEGARVEAGVQARAVYVRGEVIGDIRAVSEVRLLSSARVTGDINCPHMLMETGCQLKGRSCVRKEGKIEDKSQA